MAVTVVPSALGLDFTDVSALTPEGIVGTPYSFQFTANEGCPPYHYKVLNGNFPPGLTLADSGQVSGSPTVPGEFDFWLELSDTAGSSCTVSHSEQPFRIEIIAAMLVATPALPSANLNAAYSATLAVDQNTPVDWSLVSGTLPPGLQLSTAGVISGTPTSAGSFAFTVKAKDRSSNRVATKAFTIDVVTPMALTVPAVPRAEVGSPLPTITPTASGGLTSKPYAWSLASGTLPSGLAMNPATGAISGTPAAAGSFALKLSVADAEGRTASADLTLTVAARLTLARDQRLAQATARQPYRAQLRVTGGLAPVRFRLASGVLPRGVSLAAKQGTITGVPRKAGKYRFAIQASDALRLTSSRSFLLVVAPAKKR
ncbi:MAG: Ig domain-containing protein [Gaiellaceae bacterium]